MDWIRANTVVLKVTITPQRNHDGTVRVTLGEIFDRSGGRSNNPARKTRSVRCC
jgi:hypothetical protein